MILAYRVYSRLKKLSPYPFFLISHPSSWWYVVSGTFNNTTLHFHTYTPTSRISILCSGSSVLYYFQMYTRQADNSSSLNSALSATSALVKELHAHKLRVTKGIIAIDILRLYPVLFVLSIRSIFKWKWRFGNIPWLLARAMVPYRNPCAPGIEPHLPLYGDIWSFHNSAGVGIQASDGRWQQPAKWKCKIKVKASNVVYEVYMSGYFRVVSNRSFTQRWSCYWNRSRSNAFNFNSRTSSSSDFKNISKLPFFNWKQKINIWHSIKWLQKLDLLAGS